ncbi:MAG TPA: lipopolysaccharide biosynthesis protein [Solirubrobacteraceae bacterium]|jgi:O-antigen/teichoic acid export membrane protein|nr:lipopolysaccharide biosynthesis protein [Solirubrobacteraceae bacterium]
MYDYLRRLARTGAAYQAGEAAAKGIAVVLLPLYTRHLTRADYGTADLLLTLVILVSIVIRLGLVEAFIRFYYLDADHAERDRVARAATGLVLLATTVAAALAAVFAGPLSELVLGFHDPTLMRITALGLWSFTNLEMLYALLRVDERAGTFVRASLTNVAITVALTVYLVVFRDQGAQGLLLGNFAASTAVLVGLLWVLRHRIGLRIDRAKLPMLLRFGLPTVPAEVSVFALNIIDRAYLYRLESPSAAGLYSLAVKLSAVVILATRAFQYAWPPLAYSIRDDEEARRFYALVATYYVLAAGLVVAALTLLGRWVVRLLAAPAFFAAHEALPWVALGWALYGLFLVLVVMAGRARVTTRNFPAALAGLVVNGLLLVLLVPVWGIAGAGIALCGAYLVMLAAMYAFARRLFDVAFEWSRLAQLVLVIGGVAVAGELLLPTAGVIGFVERLAALAAIPLLLIVTRFFGPEERARMRALVRRLAPAPSA